MNRRNGKTEIKIVGVQASAWDLEDSGVLLEFTALACLKSNTDIPVCVLMAKGSAGAMEKEKMPAGYQ